MQPSQWIVYFLVIAYSALATAMETCSATHRQERSLAIPPRLQWEENFGYCGEVSFVSAGLYFGQYVPQYDARSLASPGKNQAREDSQLLLGVNDEFAASQMRLNSLSWNQSGTERDFLAWVKHNVMLGYPVTMAVYENMWLFNGKTKGGNAEYDHIVPVLSIESENLSATYLDTDLMTFSDNGLYTPDSEPYYYNTLQFRDAARTRKQSNQKEASVYSVPLKKQYGIAMTGIKDTDGFTLPVRVATHVNYEHPNIKEGSSIRPMGQAVQLTVTVSNLTEGKNYYLYRYDSFATVPTGGFNQKASQASKIWSFKQVSSGAPFVLVDKVTSDHPTIYRAVPSNAP